MPLSNSKPNLPALLALCLAGILTAPQSARAFPVAISAEQGSIHQLDLTSGTTELLGTYESEYSCVDLAISTSELFCILGDASDLSVVGYDRNTGEEKWVADFPELWTHPAGIAWNESGLYVLASDRGLDHPFLLHLDSETGTELGRVALQDAEPQIAALAARSGELWVLRRMGRAERIDPSTGEILQSFLIPENFGMSDADFDVRGHLWFSVFAVDDVGAFWCTYYWEVPSFGAAPELRHQRCLKDLPPLPYVPALASFDLLDPAAVEIPANRTGALAALAGLLALLGAARLRTTMLPADDLRGARNETMRPSNSKPNLPTLLALCLAGILTASQSARAFPVAISAEQGSIHQLDLTSGTTELLGTYESEYSCLGLAMSSSELFCILGDATDLSVVGYDRNTGEEKWVADFPELWTQPAGIAWNESGLYVLASDRGLDHPFLLHLDPETGTELGRVALQDAEPQIAALAARSGELWVLRWMGRAERIDPSTGEILQSFLIPGNSGMIDADFDVRGHLWYSVLAIDDIGVLWCTNYWEVPRFGAAPELRHQRCREDFPPLPNVPPLASFELLDPAAVEIPANRTGALAVLAGLLALLGAARLRTSTPGRSRE